MAYEPGVPTLAGVSEERRLTTGQSPPPPPPPLRAPLAIRVEEVRKSFARYPALKAHAAHCEALPVFQEIVQPLAPPKG